MGQRLLREGREDDGWTWGGGGDGQQWILLKNSETELTDGCG